MLKAARATGFDCPREVKYLGCQVGIKPDYRKMWCKIIGKLQAAADLWDRKSMATGDRVLLAKAMLLSKVWYHSSVLPIPDDLIKVINKIVEKFIWAGKPHKVGRCQMRLPKKEGGLFVWDLEAKIRALQAGWIHKHLRGELKGSLEELIQETVESGQVKVTAGTY
jgi:hypothetical protein